MARVWGRIANPDGIKTWVEVSTAPDGSNDAVYVTALIQVLLLNLNESPFYAQNGIPAQPSVMTQIYPDFYVVRTQQQYAQYFASLLINKVTGVDYPLYDIKVVTHQGVMLNPQVPVPI